MHRLALGQPDHTAEWMGRDAIPRERGIVVVPDILANARGAIVSYLEWIQGSRRLVWREEEVNAKRIVLMQKASRGVDALAERRGVDLRTAAPMLGIERAAEAKRLRGVFP